MSSFSAWRGWVGGRVAGADQPSASGPPARHPSTHPRLAARPPRCTAPNSTPHHPTLEPPPLTRKSPGCTTFLMKAMGWSGLLVSAVMPVL